MQIPVGYNDDRSRGHRMERKPNRFLTGFLVWIVSFLIISSCLAPAGMFIGSISSLFTGDLIISTLGSFMCQEDSTAEIRSYKSNRVDEDGFVRPTTYYEMHCVDVNGNSIKNLGGGYALIWSGIFIFIGIIVSSIIAFLITFLIQRFFRNKSNKDPAAPLPLVKIR
jgi:hypothetical protein